MTGVAVVAHVRLGPGRCGTAWRQDEAWLRCLVDTSCAPGQGWWRPAGVSVIAGRHGWAGASSSRGALVDVRWESLAPALMSVAVVIAVFLITRRWRSARMGSSPAEQPAGAPSAAVGARVALEEVHAQLRREFDGSLQLLAALPADAAAWRKLPLLRDQVTIAAHGTERLLATVHQAGADEQVLSDCAAQARRVGAATALLHTALSVAAREPASSAGLASAIGAVEDAVDELYVVVTGAFPPA